MSKPDDARFRPGDPDPDDGIGDGYDPAPVPGFTAPQPYSVEMDDGEQPQQPASTASSHGPSAPAGPAGGHHPPASSAPFPTARPTPARPARRSRSSWILVGAFALLIVVQLVGAAVSRLGGDEDPPPVGSTTGDVPDMAAVWLLGPEDLTGSGDGDEFARNPDGAFTGPQIIEGVDAWVVAWQSESSAGWRTAGIAALDPADGTVLWERPLPGVLCADHAFDGALRCLHDDGGTWVYHQIEIATGEDTVTVDTSLRDVQTVHSSAEGLVAVGPADPAPHARMTGFAPDGTELWSIDVADLDSAELLFSHVYDSDGDPVLERPRWRDLDDGLMMLWATPGAAIIDPVTGPVLVHHCRAGTAQGDHYLCQDDDGLHRHALDGTITWSLPGARLTVPEDRSDARPVAITEPATNRFEIVPVDWETGQIAGPATYRFTQQPGTWSGIVLPPSGYTLADATIVAGDTVLVALDADTGEQLWTRPLEGDGYVFSVVQAGEVVVIDAGTNAAGLDLATGELLWTRRNTGDQLAGIDGLLVSTGYEIGVMEVP